MSRTLIQRLLIVLVALVATVVVVRIAIGTRTAKAKGPEIRTAKVERGDVISSVTASGVLQPLTTVDVKSNVGGRVDLLTVDVGDRVKKGQLLAEIDPNDTKTQLDQAQADYDATKARLDQAHMNLQLQIDQNRAQIRQAEQQLASARARALQAKQQYASQPHLTAAAIRQAQASLKSAQDDLRQLEVATIPQAKAQIQAGYDQAMANLENARKNHERQKALLAKGFVPESTVDAAQEQLAMTQAAVNVAKARLDTVDQQYAAELAASRARVDQAKAALASAEENRVQIQVREQDLKSANATVQQAEAELRLAKANLRQQEVKQRDITAARAQIARSDASLKNAKEQMSYTTIRAPRDGVVLQKYIEQGTIIASGRSSVVQGTNIIQLGDVSRMFIVCQVDETDIGSIEAGQQVDVRIDAYPNEPFEGKVVRVDPQAIVEQNVTTIPVKVEILDPDERLKPAMNADCDFITARRENVLVVPNGALNENEGTYTVTIMEASKQVSRPVEVGVAGLETTEILSGLKEGEEVVTEIIQPEETAGPAAQPNSPFNPLQRFGGSGRRGGGSGGRGGGGGGRGGGGGG